MVGYIVIDGRTLGYKPYKDIMIGYIVRGGSTRHTSVGHTVLEVGLEDIRPTKINYIERDGRTWIYVVYMLW